MKRYFKNEVTGHPLVLDFRPPLCHQSVENLSCLIHIPLVEISKKDFIALSNPMWDKIQENARLDPPARGGVAY